MKIISFLFVFYLSLCSSLLIASEHSFDEWVDQFKIKAVKKGISIKTINKIMSKAVYLPNVSKYDRYHPEF